MLMRILATALVAGVAAGLVLSVVQLAWVAPLIVEAEAYETAGSGSEGPAPGEHAGETAAPENATRRVLLTVVANILNGVGFALLLGGGIALSGRRIDWRRGLLWGLAGFAAFAAAPALGLPPDPPGVDAGPLLPRQIWWLGTAAATAAGLWLLLLTKRRTLWALGVLALAAPHVIGAPPVDVHGGPTPPELIAEFIAASLVTTGVFWLTLGGAVGFVTHRLADRA